MQLMQRLGSVEDERYIEKYITQIVSHPGSCDNVWLPTMYGFPPLEVHRKLADFWVKAAEKFRKNGISVSLQLSNSLGHGLYMAARDCSGLVYEGSPIEKMVGADGQVSDYSFCWRGIHLREYLQKQLSYYMEIKPDCVWVDDDFRASNHNPVEFGCFCSDCIKEFNHQYGSSFTRETLVEEILHGDLKWRENYIAFMRRNLADLMYEMGKTIHDISPDTVLGLQYAAHGAYTGYGYEFIFDAMKRATGKNPLSRPGGGTYDDHNPNEIIRKAVLLNWQNSMLPDYVQCKCPEIENLPFVVFGKTPAGTAFETSYYFANGNTDMSYSMLMSLNEPMEWHAREFQLMSEQRGYWERMSDVNRNTYQSGLHYFMSREIWKKKLSDSEGFFELSDEHPSEAFVLIRDAVPISYDRNDMSLILLHPETAKVLSDEEVEFLLGKNVITDGESIDILTRRGYQLGLNALPVSDTDALKMYEVFTEHSVNPQNVEKYVASTFAPGRNNVYMLEPETAGGEILALYQSEILKKNSSADGKETLGIAETIITTPKGAKWAVLGYRPWKGIVPFYKREQLLDIADYISNNTLCARLLSPVQAVLLPRKDHNGRTACVSVANCTIGESGQLQLLVRNPAGEHFMFMSQYNGQGMLNAEKIGNEYRIELPSLNAWSVGTVFIF